MTADKRQNLLLPLALFALGAAGLSASQSDLAGKYLTDIFRTYPTWFWVALLVTLTSSLVYSVNAVIHKRIAAGWVPWFVIAGICSLFVLAIPLSADYALANQWDEANHVRLMLDILEHHVPSDVNFYPMSHLLASVFSLVSGVNRYEALLLFPLIFFITYLANMIFAISRLTDDRLAFAAAMLIVPVILFGHFTSSFRPTYHAVVMFPLFIGLFLQSHLRSDYSLPDRLTLICISIFLPFLHPWGVLAPAIFIFGTVLQIIVIRFFDERPQEGSNRGFTSAWSPLAILLVTWLMWFMSFRHFGRYARRITEAFIRGIQGAHSLEGYLDTTTRASLSFPKIISLVFARYGTTILYLGLAVLLISVLVYQVFWGKAHIQYRVYLFPASILAFILLAALSLTRDLVTASPLRLSNFAVVVVPLLVAPFAEAATQPPQARDRSLLGFGTIHFSLLMLLTIGSSTALGIIGAFRSPRTGHASVVAPYSQIAGISFLTNRALDDDSPIYSPFEGASYLSAPLSTEGLYKLRQRSDRWSIRLAPDRLDFSFLESGRNDPDGAYLVMSSFELAYYRDVWPSEGRIKKADIEQLDYHPQWIRIYDSGGFTIWRWNGSR